MSRDGGFSLVHLDGFVKFTSPLARVRRGAVSEHTRVIRRTSVLDSLEYT